jgi:hypothetical protein
VVGITAGPVVVVEASTDGPHGSRDLRQVFVVTQVEVHGRRPVGSSDVMAAF